VCLTMLSERPENHAETQITMLRAVYNGYQAQWAQFCYWVYKALGYKWVCLSFCRFCHQLLLLQVP
jgi:hypothetical protein